MQFEKRRHGMIRWRPHIILLMYLTHSINAKGYQLILVLEEWNGFG